MKCGWFKSTVLLNYFEKNKSFFRNVRYFSLFDIVMFRLSKHHIFNDYENNISTTQREKKYLASIRYIDKTLNILVQASGGGKMQKKEFFLHILFYGMDLAQCNVIYMHMVVHCI